MECVVIFYVLVNKLSPKTFWFVDYFALPIALLEPKTTGIFWIHIHVWFFLTFLHNISQSFSFNENLAFCLKKLWFVIIISVFVLNHLLFIFNIITFPVFRIDILCSFPWCFRVLRCKKRYLFSYFIQKCVWFLEINFTFCTRLNFLDLYFKFFVVFYLFL